jgi:hypothetical protein
MLTISLCCTVLTAAVAGVCAQSPDANDGGPFSSHRIARVVADRGEIFMTSAPDAVAQWRRADRPVWLRGGEQGPVKSQRSKRKTALIGTALGGAVGLAAGVYVSQATAGDADPWAIPGFTGVGAAVGALAGFVVALF